MPEVARACTTDPSISDYMSMCWQDLKAQQQLLHIANLQTQHASQPLPSIKIETMDQTCAATICQNRTETDTYTKLIESHSTATHLNEIDKLVALVLDQIVQLLIITDAAHGFLRLQPQPPGSAHATEQQSHGQLLHSLTAGLMSSSADHLCTPQMHPNLMHIRLNQL